MHFLFVEFENFVLPEERFFSSENLYSAGRTFGQVSQAPCVRYQTSANSVANKHLNKTVQFINIVKRCV